MRRLALLLVLVGVLAAACGRGDGENVLTANPGDANERLVGTFETLDGETIDLATVHDQDVVLWMWAPW